jgi:phospholipid/cholesterol/gamma-HCH transport system substrate-binding protein
MTSPNPSRREQASRTFERIKTEPGLARNSIVVIALIVIAAVVGAIILANQRFIAPWETRQIFYAAFEATPGISPGNGQEVRIAGVNVGDIVGAEVDEHGQAVLKLALEQGHKIYKNASLVLRPKSPLNEMYVTINPGGPPSELIPPNYAFPQSSTVRPVEVDEVLNHLDDNAQRALTDLLAESDVALTNSKTTLPPGLDATRKVTDDLKPVAEQLSVRKEKIRRLVTDLGQISKAIGGDDKRVATLAAGLQTTLNSLGTHQPQLNQTVATLPGLIKNLKRSTDSVIDLSDQLDPTLRNLQDASDVFPKALRRFEDTSDKLDDVVDAARPFIHELRPVIRDLKPFTHDLEDALPPLHRATQKLDPITNALLPYLPDTAAFAVQTRSLLSLEDANGGILRGALYMSTTSAPPITGMPNNGLKPVPLPAIDKGESALQGAVPSPFGGPQAPPQDGSLPRRSPRPETPGGEKGNPLRLLPAPGGDDAPRARHGDGDSHGGGLLGGLGN